MEELRFVDACEEAHFAAMSAIHCRGWHKTYPGYVPEDYLREAITPDHWIPLFREQYQTGQGRGLLLYRGDCPVACCTYGSARAEADSPYAGCGELFSFYTDPAETSRGYGSLLMEETLSRLSAMGFSRCCVFVLRENAGARRFYQRHGFSWDGSSIDIPFPHEMICVDLRYTKAFSAPDK